MDFVKKKINDLAQAIKKKVNDLPPEHVVSDYRCPARCAYICMCLVLAVYGCKAIFDVFATVHEPPTITKESIKWGAMPNLTLKHNMGPAVKFAFADVWIHEADWNFGLNQYTQSGFKVVTESQGLEDGAVWSGLPSQGSLTATGRRLGWTNKTGITIRATEKGRVLTFDTSVLEPVFSVPGTVFTGEDWYNAVELDVTWEAPTSSDMLSGDEWAENKQISFDLGYAMPLGYHEHLVTLPVTMPNQEEWIYETSARMEKTRHYYTDNTLLAYFIGQEHWDEYKVSSSSFEVWDPSRPVTKITETDATTNKSMISNENDPYTTRLGQTRVEIDVVKSTVTELRYLSGADRVLGRLGKLGGLFPYVAILFGLIFVRRRVLTKEEKHARELTIVFGKTEVPQEYPDSESELQDEKSDLL